MEFVLFDVDENLRETTQHGSEEFPVAIYLQELLRNRDGCVILHWHNEVQFIIVKRGTVEYRVDQQCYLLHPGQALFINSKCLHMARPSGGENAAYICIDVHPRFLGGYGGRVSRNYVTPLLASKTLSAIILDGEEDWQKQSMALLNHIVEIYEVQPFAWELTLQQMFLALWELLLLSHQQALEDTDAATIAEQERLEAVLAFIHTHFAERVTLEDIASAASISPGECCRFFKRMLRVSPMSYLNQFRIVQSTSLLSGTALSVAEIAHQVGFSSSSYFTARFKQMMNCRPLEYRSRFGLKQKQ